MCIYLVAYSFQSCNKLPFELIDGEKVLINSKHDQLTDVIKKEEKSTLPLSFNREKKVIEDFIDLNGGL